MVNIKNWIYVILTLFNISLIPFKLPFCLISGSFKYDWLLSSSFERCCRRYTHINTHTHTTERNEPNIKSKKGWGEGNHMSHTSAFTWAGIVEYGVKRLTFPPTQRAILGAAVVWRIKGEEAIIPEIWDFVFVAKSSTTPPPWGIAVR